VKNIYYLSKMKKIIVVPFLFICFLGMTQTYTPLVIEGSVWITHLDVSGIGAPFGSIDREYYLNGDSAISSINYKKLYYRAATYPNQLSSSVFSLFALMREDSVNRKVYGIFLDSDKYSCVLNQETLLYNFNLQINDSLKTDSSCLLLNDQKVLNITLGKTISVR